MLEMIRNYCEYKQNKILNIIIIIIIIKNFQLSQENATFSHKIHSAQLSDEGLYSLHAFTSGFELVYSRKFRILIKSKFYITNYITSIPNSMIKIQNFLI